MFAAMEDAKALLAHQLVAIWLFAALATAMRDAKGSTASSTFRTAFALALASSSMLRAKASLQSNLPAALELALWVVVVAFRHRLLLYHSPR